MRRVSFALLLVTLALPAAAQNHTTQFEVSEDFLKAWAHNPVRDVRVTLDCAGPVHDPEDDCELHIGAAFVDPSIGDFQDVVLEPPNICKDNSRSWRSVMNALHGRECISNGFVRAWPEHLKSGQGCSNPKHALEVHPMIHLDCGSGDTFDFTSMLVGHDDLGFKPPATVKRMLDMKVWACRGCESSEGLSTVSFDYCIGSPCKAGQASNFGRFKVRVIRSTIRPEEGKTIDGFASVIARVSPVASTSAQMRVLKLYAVQGTAFYDKLLAQRGKTGSVPTWEVIGIFTIDPFSVLRAMEDEQFVNGTWSEVPHPVSLITFGTVQ